jgi:hypothetical protein
VFWLHGTNDEEIPLNKVQGFLVPQDVTLQIVENGGHILDPRNSCRRIFGMWRDYQKSFDI